MQRYIVIVFLMMQHLILRNSFKQFFRDHRFTMVNFAKKASPSSSSSSSSSELKKKKASPSISKMNVTEAKLELEYLSSQLTRHNELYYNLNAPEISDASYDKLKRRAEDILGRFGDLRSLFPQFESVGGSASNHFAPYAHSQPMLSLDNAFTKVEIGKFLERLSKLTRGGHDANIDVTFDDVIVEPKIDGLSLSIEYVDGILRRAGTRGDGQNGEDVTQNLDLIVDLPTRIRNIEESVRYMEVRGEVFMSRNDFLALNDAQVLANQTSFANCRNAAAGSLRRVLSSSSISSNTTSLRRLNFFAYALLAKSVEENTYLPVDISQSELLPKLETMGFNTAQPAIHVTNKDSSEAMLESVWDSCQHLLSLRTNLPYDIDGAVIKANSASDRRIVGDGRRSPKWALAYKFPEDEQTTQLLSVTIQVGRTGLLTPVANLSPVSIGGVVIERATLHNEDEVNRLGLADFLMNGGDPVRVLVKRAGDVIPKIVRTLAPVDAERSGSLRYMLPDRCPVCNSPTEREESTVGVRCTGGLICSAQVVEKLR